MQREKSLDEMMEEMERSALSLGIDAPQGDEAQTPEDRASMEDAVEMAREGRSRPPPPSAAADAARGIAAAAAGDAATRLRPMQPTTPGNIDLGNRPRAIDPANGKTATVRSMSFGDDSGETLVPTVSDDGRIMGDEEAIENYRKTGQHLGKFRTPGAATAYAEQLHEDQDAMYGDRRPTQLPPIARRPVADPPPKNRNGPPDWDALLKDRRAAALAGNVVESGNSMLAQMGPPGWQFKPTGSVQREVAALPLEMTKERQAFEQREAATDRLRRDVAAKGASTDPNSPESQRAREAFASFIGSENLPPGFNGWSAADVKAWAGPAGSARGVREKNLDDAAKAKAAADKAAADKTALDAARKNYADILKSMNIDPETATQKDVDRAIALKNAKATQAVADSNLGLRKKEVGLREEEVVRKRTEGLPFGWTLKEGANPSEQQRQKAFDIATAQKQLNTNTRHLEQVLAQPVSVEREKAIAQAVQEIGNQIRVMEGLGVPSGPDTRITAEITGNPAGAVSRFTGDGPRAMGELRRYGTVKVNSIADTLGADVGTPQSVAVRRRDTGEVKSFPPEQAEKILKNPNFVRAD